MKQIRFTIPLKPRTKKNHTQIIKNPHTGKPMIIQSQAYREYEKDCAYFIPKVNTPISTPVNVKGLFYMPTRRRVDLVNLEQALLDVLVKYGLLKDDNYKIVVSMDGSRVLYDKTNSRTEVIISEQNDCST